MVYAVFVDGQGMIGLFHQRTQLGIVKVISMFIEPVRGIRRNAEWSNGIPKP